jgi:hypothetical protein
LLDKIQRGAFYTPQFAGRYQISFNRSKQVRIDPELVIQYFTGAFPCQIKIRMMCQINGRRLIRRGKIIDSQ